jgi:hypothetical protein
MIGQQWRTEWLHIGREALVDPSVEPVRHGDELHRPGVVETCAAGEVRWTVLAQPRARGALVVSGRGGPIVSGAVRDAEGRSAKIEIRTLEGRTELTVPAAFVTTAAFPLTVTAQLAPAEASGG